MKKFIAPDVSDKRISYASLELQRLGYQLVNNECNADFALLPVNPDKSILPKTIPVVNYLYDEGFAVENAYLTAEAALSIACEQSERSLINSSVLIVGYGRIGKALHKFLSPFTGNITVCARKDYVRSLAFSNGACAIDFEQLVNANDYDFVFNTVVHPVINSRELSAMKPSVLLIELASFPGGIDTHSAAAKGLKLIIARGLPGKYSPESAGAIVAKTVDKIVREKSE